MNSGLLTSQLKEHALSHGIDLIGITSAKPFIKRDKANTFVDPKNFLHDARSIIVTAFYMNEDVGAPVTDPDHPKGRFTHGYSIRAYTPMENHYIKVVRGFLKKRGYQAVSNKNYKIPDKMAAVRAGIGKYGKNSVILTGEYGSFVMFVTLVTNAPLEFEECDLDKSNCGSCENCLKSCPTGAIDKPFQVKREMCITDWLWGKFVPIHLREKQENRIFGCGECVKACPKNKKLATRKEYPVKIEDVSTAPELIPLAAGDEATYRKNIASFPMRAGVEAIRGNAIIALGNIGSGKAVDPLCAALTHRKPQIRAYSAWALGKIGGAKAERTLKNTFKIEKNRNVKREIQHILDQMNPAA